MAEIKDRVLAYKLIDWRKLEWLQGNLKELTNVAFEKLKSSLISKGFIQPFNVWENGKKIWCLDGHHRKRAMEALEKDGMKIPEKLGALFIECKDKKDAQEKVLVYSSIFANITDEGLYEYLHKSEIEFLEIKPFFSPPKIELQQFETGYITDNNNAADFLSEFSEKPDEVIDEERYTLKGEKYFTLTFSLTSGDRDIVISKLKKVAGEIPNGNTNSALVKVCNGV